MNSPPPLAGSELPQDDHVLRYIGPRHFENGVLNGDGFLRRPSESSASVNWLECFDPPVEAQVECVRARKRIKYARNGKLARINVGYTISYVRTNDPGGLVLKFVHDPLQQAETHVADYSHSLIIGIPIQESPEASLVKDLIAECVIEPVFSAR